MSKRKKPQFIVATKDMGHPWTLEFVGMTSLLEVRKCVRELEAQGYDRGVSIIVDRLENWTKELQEHWIREGEKYRPKRVEGQQKLFA